MRNERGITLIALVIVRIGSQLPVPGVDASFISEWFNNPISSLIGYQ